MHGMSQPVRFIALGDSYTIGEGVAPDDRWPLQLARLLMGEGLDMAEPEIVARTGWTTDELSAGIDQANPHGPYDFVSLLIGVNNQYRGRAVEEYRGQFIALLERAIDLAGGRKERVLVLSIPDWGVTPYARGRDREKIAAAIDGFNRAARDECERRGINYVDVTSVSRLAAANPTWIAADGLHPSGQMYAEWARLALPAARAALVE